MSVAFVKGAPAPLEEAIAAAARLVARARLTVVAGLETDVAGIRAAARLAEKVGGVLDCTDASSAELNIMRAGGSMVISAAEARRICDLFLLIGPGVSDIVPGVAHHRLSGPSLAADLACLRAMAAGRPLRNQPKRLKIILSAILKARFGAAVWRAGNLAEPVAEMATGLVRDLNASARFSSLILPERESGANLVLGWLTGFPARTSLARGLAEHDPWAFDAGRLVESGEADLVVWISSAAPPWRRRIGTIAITQADCRLDRADIQLIAATPGREHDAVLFDPEIGSFVHRGATARSDVVSVAALLERLGGAS